MVMYLRAYVIACHVLRIIIICMYIIMLSMLHIACVYYKMDYHQYSQMFACIYVILITNRMNNIRIRIKNVYRLYLILCVSQRMDHNMFTDETSLHTVHKIITISLHYYYYYQ